MISVKFNWLFFTGIAFIIYLLFPTISWYSYFATLITIHQFILVFNAIGSVIPIRYIFGAMMSLQLLFGPMLAYNGLDKFQFGYYVMQIPESDYFSYVIPAVIAFIAGLHFVSRKLEGELINEIAIYKYVNQNPNLPYILISVGFIASMIKGLFSSELSFIFYLLGGFKFIGAFILIIGNRKLKIIPLIIVYGSIFVSSLGEGMFHDLITWLIFLASVFAIKFKPGFKVKITAFTLFIISVLTIQLLKGGYRDATWGRGEKSGLASFNKAYVESKTGNTFFSYRSLAENNIRINQGYIITNIMKTVPDKVPFAKGIELKQILEAAILPRFIASDKLKAGDQTLFKMYTGMPLAKSTSMALSSIGDAYINFGVFGGCIFMFLLGLLYSEVLKAFHRYSKYYPVLLLFTPLVFYYPIRPDCELQTILGHLVKSCFLIYVVFLVWRRYFRESRES